MNQQAIKQSPLFHISQQTGATWSELARWQVVEHYGNTAAKQTAVLQSVGIRDLSAWGKIIVQGERAADAVHILFPHISLVINEGAMVDGAEIYPLRSDQFILLTSPDAEQEIGTRLETAAQQIDGLVTVTDVTHGRAQIQLVGPASHELLGRLCGLDFHPTSFPKGFAKQSSVAKTTQLIVHHQTDIVTYSIIGARSFAVYLWETILTAGRDLGIRPIGVGSL